MICTMGEEGAWSAWEGEYSTSLVESAGRGEKDGFARLCGSHVDKENRQRARQKRECVPRALSFCVISKESFDCRNSDHYFSSWMRHYDIKIPADIMAIKV